MELACRQEAAATPATTRAAPAAGAVPCRSVTAPLPKRPETVRRPHRQEAAARANGPGRPHGADGPRGHPLNPDSRGGPQHDRARDPACRSQRLRPVPTATPRPRSPGAPLRLPERAVTALRGAPGLAGRAAPASQRALAGRISAAGKAGRISVVLHKTELVALGIGHDDDYALVVVVSFVGGPSSQAGNELDSLVDAVDGHVKMDADLPCLRLGNRLEDQPRLGIAAMAQVDPAGLRRPRLATEQGAPEARDPLRVRAVDGHSRHEVRHVRHLTVAPRCRGGAQDQLNAEPIAA